MRHANVNLRSVKKFFFTTWPDISLLGICFSRSVLSLKTTYYNADFTC